MNRTLFRNIWLMSIVLLIGTAYHFFNKGQKTNQLVFQKNAALASLKRKRDEVRKLATELNTLDKRTINETTATQLSILRHLNLEDRNYNVTVISKQSNDFAGVPLYARKVNINTEVPYKEALQVTDALKQTEKLSFDQIELRRSTGYGDKVNITIIGTMYGLEKND